MRQQHGPVIGILRGAATWMFVIYGIVGLGWARAASMGAATPQPFIESNLAFAGMAVITYFHFKHVYLPRIYPDEKTLSGLSMSAVSAIMSVFGTLGAVIAGVVIAVPTVDPIPRIGLGFVALYCGWAFYLLAVRFPQACAEYQSWYDAKRKGIPAGEPAVEHLDLEEKPRSENPTGR